MKTFEVNIRMDCGHLDVEVDFEDGYEPTDDEIHDAAVEVIEDELSRSKLSYYNQK